ncbi:MAG: carotenoid biosynthesis protein [Anaerolineales bacterium]|nr:carotenoid biosynthesis protein [Anaerolineales bacterium]MDP3184336.1 carotenoid biosynthesis protein [Anaerolineales bacterium]
MAAARSIATPETRQPAFVLVSALTFTAWDLFLDPQMAAWDFWQWDAPGLYFGIPLTNFLGWLAVSALITLLIGPRGLPAAPLAFVYAATWLLQTIGLGLFWGQPGPALFGFTGMGTMVLLAVLRARRLRVKKAEEGNYSADERIKR